MSLTALFDRLGSLLPKYFIIGAAMPVLIFGFVNGVIAYWSQTWFRVWTRANVLPAPKAFSFAVMLVGLAVLAYLLSTLNGVMRDVLEGKGVLGRWTWLKQAQQQKLKQLREDYIAASNTAGQITGRKAAWKENLISAVEAGQKKDSNAFNPTGNDAAEQIDKLNEKWEQLEPIKFGEIKNAVEALKKALTENNIGKPEAWKASDVSRKRTLEQYWSNMQRLIDDVAGYWEAEDLRCFNDLARYGIGNAAPTALGNVGESMRGYGLRRYGFDLDTYWSRFQPVLASADKDFYSSLQDAKTQVDFHVACCWLSLLTTVCWLPDLWWQEASFGLFWGVALCGPAMAWGFYLLAVESYVVFAGLVRAGVDLYRFLLLQNLHIAVPANLREERETWSALRKIMAFGQERADISYQNDAKTGDA
jgi:hypothetical protein